MDIKPYMKALGYSRGNTRHIVVEQDGKLWLSLSSQAASTFIGSADSQDTGLLEINAIVDGQPVPYEYTATVSQIDITTANGSATIVLDRDSDSLRFKGEGFALRLDGKTAASRVTSLNKPDGTEISIGGGMYFFKAVAGTISFDDSWIVYEFHSVTPVLDLAPDNGKFELIAYLLPAETDPPDITKSFKESADENAADFAAFCAKLIDTPAQWDDVREKIAYMLWAGHRTEESGMEVIVSNKRLTAGAQAWQLAVASLAFKDLKTALNLISALPMSSPPVQGLAALRLFDDGLFEKLGRDLVYKLYEPLGENLRFWLETRTGTIQNLHVYAYRYESSLKAPKTFCAGAPVASPDLNAYIVLAEEVMAKLAEHANDSGAAGWRDRARLTFGALIGNLWNGDDFVGMNVYTGEKSDPDDVLSLIPLILGKRLPSDTAAKLAAKVNADTLKDALGALIVLGLKDAGFDESAKDIVTAALNSVRSNGIECPYFGAALLALAAKAL